MLIQQSLPKSIRTMVQPQRTKWWMMQPHNNLAHRYTTPGPENLLELLEGETEYRVDDLREACRLMGLQASSWEYMWMAAHDALKELYEGSLQTKTGGLYQQKFGEDFYQQKFGKDMPIPIHGGWRWFSEPYSMLEIVYAGDLARWSAEWPITASAAILTLELNPVRINKFCMSCRVIAKWCMFGGKRPDMKFPYPKDQETAYHQISAEYLMRRLAE